MVDFFYTRDDGSWGRRQELGSRLVWFAGLHATERSILESTRPFMVVCHAML